MSLRYDKCNPSSTDPPCIFVNKYYMIINYHYMIINPPPHQPIRGKKTKKNGHFLIGIPPRATENGPKIRIKKPSLKSIPGQASKSG